ncbi:EAL domain-containing protein [Methylobacterium sp. J-076]|uniref:bifunctional diguanylate cyclase/phosphodiesterase n=1 Tax=Methylobacterium sp. J-076 TaxID=2836655 RepID=UPI001FBA910E|nr:EAL domain-containing protein [Methylobacterium sp. J-076]MCJ2015199.1 EAL domain-containing protein [Methylobacterium sp. J-076]
MYRALSCLTCQHLAWAMPLATLVGFVSCLAAFVLLRQARADAAGGPSGWIGGAGAAAGLGIWSAHFIAMLGFDSGVGIAYDLPLTGLSLVVGVVSSCLALLPALLPAVFLRGDRGAAGAGILLGLGIAAMQAIGMEGVRLPGVLTWNRPMTAIAVAVGCGLAAAALVVARRARRWPGDVAAAALLTGAIACLDAIAVADLALVPDPTLAPGGETFPRGVLALGIAVGMLTLLAIAALALLVQRLRRTNRSLRDGKRLLREKSELLDTVLETMDQGLMMVDRDGLVRVCNERAVALLGLPPGMMRALPSFTAVRHHQIAQGRFDRAPEIQRHWSHEGLSLGEAHAFEHQGPDDGVMEVRVAPLAGGGAVLTFTDISARKRAENRMAQNEARLALALDAGSDGLWDSDLVTGTAWCSDRWWQILGYRPGELQPHARTWRMLVHPEDVALTERVLADHLEGRTALYECEHRMRRSDGSWAWFLTRGRVVARAGDGTPLRFVCTQIDVSARKAAEGQIAHMARHDGLTDLPNRALFYERLEERLAELRQRRGAAAVLYLDLDRFKAVNDRLGHQAGDTVLRAVAHRIRLELGPEDAVARLGGDEFAVLVADGGDRGAVAGLARRLIAAVNAPIPYGEQRTEVGLSIGIALVPEHGNTGEEACKRADLALYRAKLEGRNTHRIYESAMDEAVAERRDLECDLRRAIEKDELTLHYQPQVTTGGRDLVGFEALVRWRHPTRGLVPPSVFVPLAEESGMILALGEWVLRAACREAATWDRPLKIAVNLSPLQFQQADLAERILSILAEAGLPPSRLELEITESVIINDMTRALNILSRLKSFGISIAMDDFGTGYSSLATLQAFPFDKIKIDRSFVGHVEGSPPAAVIVRAVLGLGRSLGMSVVAEGVETADQMQFLTNEACDEVQGYLVGRPQPIELFARYVRGDAAAADWAVDTFLQTGPRAPRQSGRPLKRAGMSGG